MIRMKTKVLVLAAAGVCLMAGCASNHNTALVAEDRISNANAPGVGYDDLQIAKIQRGETGEAQLLEWFGMPESREVKPDGQAHLSWSFSRRTDGGRGRSGVLNVNLAANGKVEAYSARGGTLSEKRSVEFVEKSDTDLREHMKQWQEEGWNLLNFSARLPQPDGTVHRKVELSRSNGTAGSGFGYDDRRIGGIQRGETTATQLVEWFGPPYSRNLQPDGRVQLAWSFTSRTDGGPGHSGELAASLAPDGKVDAFSARRGPE
jgi:hypothetical protein